MCLLVTKQEEDHFPSGIAGIVELINCTWKLIDNTVFIFCRLVFSRFSDFCFHFVSYRHTIMFCLFQFFCVVFAYT